MHGKLVRGRALEVKFANADSSATGAGANGLGVVSDNIYVKGLPPHWTEHELRAYFKMFGAIIEFRLFHASGTTTAGALIRFGSMEQAAGAVLTANGRVPAGGVVPLVIRFADSHGKSRRASKNEKAANGEGVRQGRVRAERRAQRGGLNGPPTASPPPAHHPGSARTAGRTWGADPGASTPGRVRERPDGERRARGARPERLRAQPRARGDSPRAAKRGASRARARRWRTKPPRRRRPSPIDPFGAGSFASPARGGGVNVSGWADPGDDLDSGAAGAMHPAHVGGPVGDDGGGARRPTDGRPTDGRPTNGRRRIRPRAERRRQPPAPPRCPPVAPVERERGESQRPREQRPRRERVRAGVGAAAGAQGGFIETGGLGRGPPRGFTGDDVRVPVDAGLDPRGCRRVPSSAAHNPAPRSSPGSFGHLREPHATTAVSPVGSFDGGGLWR